MVIQKLKNILAGIKHRCTNKNNCRYKYYGGKGIKCLISYEDLVYLWDRDNAKEMEKPSIDRIDSDKNYELSNCRFIELSENSKRIFDNDKFYTLVCSVCGKEVKRKRFVASPKCSQVCKQISWAERRKKQFDK